MTYRVEDYKYVDPKVERVGRLHWRATIRVASPGPGIPPPPIEGEIFTFTERGAWRAIERLRSGRSKPFFGGWS